VAIMLRALVDDDLDRLFGVAEVLLRAGFVQGSPL
jgi:hypothetical protein